MKHKIILVIMFFCLFLMPQTVCAHPHGWIEAYADFLMKDGKVTDIQAKWNFDEMTSMMLVETMDTNEDQKLDSTELLAIEDQVIKIIKNRGFFSSVYINNKRQNLEEIKFSTVFMNNDIINFNFVIPLKEPVDLSKKKLALSFYDPSYYYEVYFAEENPVSFSGITSQKLDYTKEEDLDNLYYFDTVNPEIIRINYLGEK